MTVAAVICAAGLSSRMGRSNTTEIKKEYLKLNDSTESLTVLGAAAGAFLEEPLIDIIVIVIPENTEANARAALSPEFFSVLKPKIFFVNGGQTRRASVFNALSFLIQYNPDYVLIHDGARPWVTPSLINDIITSAQKYGAVIPALSLSDTPKECNAPLFDKKGQGADKPVFVARHLKRANTVVVQTPQGFKFKEILLAHEKAAKAGNEEFTDDAEVFGRFCGDVAVIPGLPENRKITFPQDMVSQSIKISI